VWPTYLTAPLAVAAVAARLLALTERQAAHALGIAISMSSPSVGRQSGTMLSRWLAVGQAARNGALAAYAAESGFTADSRLFEGEFFQAAYGLSLDGALLLDGLGERSALLETSLKPWCAARQTMTASQGLRELIESGIAAADVSKIVAWVPPLQLKMVDHGTHSGDRGSYLTSLPHQVAIAALGPGAGTEEIDRFMAKVSVAADDALLQAYPKAWPARVVVTTSSGEREKLALHVPGDPERPFDELQVAAKFWRLTAPLVGERATESALRLGFAALDAEDGPKTLLEAVERTAAAQAENA
jgi:2-methylcitrate dehydratase PrpD